MSFRTVTSTVDATGSSGDDGPKERHDRFHKRIYFTYGLTVQAVASVDSLDPLIRMPIARDAALGAGRSRTLVCSR